MKAIEPYIVQMMVEKRGNHAPARSSE
jgi:hypothetical protein